MILVPECFRHGLLAVNVFDRRQKQLRLLIVNGQADLLKRFFLSGVQREVVGEILVRDCLEAEVGHGQHDPCNSNGSKSMSHCAISSTLLSARRKALI